MTRRIMFWALAGFLVAGLWALYATLTSPPALTSADPLWLLAEFTCPIAAASIHMNFGVSLFWSLAANAATYALAGTMMEILRRRLHHAH
jgi:hypothetical protein